MTSENIPIKAEENPPLSPKSEDEKIVCDSLEKLRIQNDFLGFKQEFVLSPLHDNQNQNYIPPLNTETSTQNKKILPSVDSLLEPPVGALPRRVQSAKIYARQTSDRGSPEPKITSNIKKTRFLGKSRSMSAMIELYREHEQLQTEFKLIREKVEENKKQVEEKRKQIALLLKICRARGLTIRQNYSPMKGETL